LDRGGHSFEGRLFVSFSLSVALLFFVFFFFFVFGYTCQSSHCGLGPCRDHIRAFFGTQPVAAVIKVAGDLGF
jgi:hypothetical protein